MTNWDVNTYNAIAHGLVMVDLENPMEPAEPYGFQHGMAPLASLPNTKLRVVFDSLATANLPFRVKSYAKVEGSKNGEPQPSSFSLPPVQVNPGGDGISNFFILVCVLTDMMACKISNMEGALSDCMFEHILRLRFYFLAKNNLAALHAHLPRCKVEVRPVCHRSSRTNAAA